MSENDWSDLDVRMLQLLVAVVDAGSVTGAAHRLGVTQSAISHGIERLRDIVGNPLFVKSGRGIVATSQATLLAQRARILIEELKAFSVAAGFDPARLVMRFTIAANDLQRDLLLPPLLRRLRKQAPGVTLRIIPSGAPLPSLLRDSECQLLITPRPPDGADIRQKRLFDDHYVIFYDPLLRSIPQSMTDYVMADHVSVLYDSSRKVDIDDWFENRRINRRIVVTVPGMAAIASVVHGTDMLATAPSLLRFGALRGLATCPLPLTTPILPMYMVWHGRHQTDPIHQWLRNEVQFVSEKILPPMCQIPTLASTSS